jgi:hypothetical protein
MVLGEQTLERLKSMPRDELRGFSEGREGKEISSNVLLEKAAIKETRNWEEESNESETGGKIELENKKAIGGKEKLVDV